MSFISNPYTGLFNSKISFYATTSVLSLGTTSSTTTSLAYLFHPSSNTNEIHINRIRIDLAGGANALTTTSFLAIYGCFITAENGTPGGTTVTPVATNRNYSESAGIVWRYGATGAPTRVSPDLIGGLYTVEDHLDLKDGEFGLPITLRNGVSEGFEVRAVLQTAYGTAMNAVVTYYWTEFSSLNGDI